MHFLAQLAKATVLYGLIVFALVFTGLEVDSAKFGVLATLGLFGAIFFFLYDYMEAIGLFETVPLKGFTKNDTPDMGWKILGTICFLIGIICWVIW